MAGAAVQVNQVCKDFSSGNGKQNNMLRILNQITFSVNEGEIVALTGTSGCGKTTLLRIIMGLESVTEGSVSIGNKVVTGPGYDRGIVFQHAELLPWRSALANVEFGLEVKGMPVKERREKAEYYLEMVGLKHAMYRRPDQLSGGMKQRVGIARALAIDPDVLLMDEPFGALDAQTRENLQEEVLRIHTQTKKTIIFVTHDLDEAVLLADKVVVMSPNPGTIQEIKDINIPRPRNDIVAIRGSEEFTQKKYFIWKKLKSHGLLNK